jgi:hypothetical protein
MAGRSHVLANKGTVASKKQLLTGAAFAQLSPAEQLAALVGVANKETDLIDLTFSQLAAIGRRSLYEFRKARAVAGGPIRPKRKRAAAPVPPKAAVVDVAAAPPVPPASDDIAAILHDLGPHELRIVETLLKARQTARQSAAAAEVAINGAHHSGNGAHPPVTT